MTTSIQMPMITLHGDATGWYEIHHGALRQLLPLHEQATGRATKNYPPSLTGNQALLAARAANPGVDVQLIDTVMARNVHELWAGQRDRRAA